MREYDLRGMSKWRYRELKALCRQYRDIAGREEARMIEAAAARADPAGAAAILRCVADGVPYERCGYAGSKTSFYRTRRMFFMLLDAALREKENKTP